MGQLCSYLTVYFCNWFILEVSLEMALLKINHFLGKWLESFMVTVGDCKYLGHFKITEAAFYGSELEALLLSVLHFEHVRAVFSALCKCVSFLPVWRLKGLLFRNKSFRHYSFSRDNSAYHLCFWTFGSDHLRDTSVSLCIFFFTITPTCSSTFIQNTVVKHVPWATAASYDIFVQIRQRRRSGWTWLYKSVAGEKTTF